MFNSYRANTLEYDRGKCTACGLCWQVCPHAVFVKRGRKAELTNSEACMECGACQMNCPAGAIRVHSGVGCAAAMIKSALRGKDGGGEECC